MLSLASQLLIANFRYTIQYSHARTNSQCLPSGFALYIHPPNQRLLYVAIVRCATRRIHEWFPYAQSFCQIEWVLLFVYKLNSHRTSSNHKFSTQIDIYAARCAMIVWHMDCIHSAAARRHYVSEIYIVIVVGIMTRYLFTWRYNEAYKKPQVSYTMRSLIVLRKFVSFVYDHA